MTLEEIAAFIASAKAQGVSEAEMANADARLKVIVTAQTPAIPVPPAPPAPLLIKAQFFGRFCTTPAAVTTGSRLQTGDILGFLEIGAIRTAMTAPCDGVLAKALVSTGDLVGYGQPVFELA